jgi:PmbA protein
MWATYRDGVSRVALANSRGLRAGYARTLSLVTLTCVGSGGPYLHTEWVSAGPDPEGVKETATARARLQPVGGDEAVGESDLLLESAAAAVLVRHLLPDLQEDPAGGREPGGADFQRLASEAVTIVDDGLLPGGVASAPFDGEGNPTGRVTLVKAGVRIDRLRWLKPGESGRPGNAVRASYRDLPRPGGTNLCVVPGGRPLASLVAGLEKGLFLETLEGDIREVRTGTGGSRWRGLGWEVRDGKRIGACRRFVFAAQPRDLLERIFEVSNRLTFSLRRGMALGVPDLLIRCRQ